MEAMIGPVIFDIAGQTLTVEDKALLRNPACGGVIFFAPQNIGPDKIRQLCTQIKEINPYALIMVDQEGGRVQRFKKGFTRLPSISMLGRAYKKDPEFALSMSTAFAHQMASELKAVGVDMSLAPVVDRVLTQSQVLKNRTFSEDKLELLALARAFVHGMDIAAMPAVLKHFPGHGGVWADSHTDLPEDLRSQEALLEDALPFSTLIQEGAQAIMPAHIRYPAVDSQLVTFSPTWLQQILRQQLGFNGAIISDDLTMGAAAKVYDTYTERVHWALKAGCDFLLVCQNRKGAIEALSAAKSLESSAESLNRRWMLKKACERKPQPLGEMSEKFNAWINTNTGA